MKTKAHHFPILLLILVLAIGLHWRINENTAGAVSVGTTVLTSVTNETGGVNLKWNKVSSGTGYMIYRKTGTGAYSRIAVVSGNTVLTYKDKTAKNGSTYTYKIRAYKGSRYGNYSSAKSVFYLAEPSLSLNNTDYNCTKVSWSRNAAASGYYIYRKTGTGGYSKVAAVSGNTVTSWADYDVKSGTTYTYAVRAYKNSWLSCYTGKLNMYLSPLTKSLVTVNNGMTGSRIYWPAIAGAKSYNVYRRVVGGAYHMIANVAGTYYMDPDVSSGVSYDYAVRAVNGSYLGNFNSIRTMFLTALSTDKVSVFNAMSGSRISWTSVEGAVNYNVYRRTEGGNYSLIANVEDTSYIDLTAESGILYNYAVRAVNGSYIGNYNSIRAMFLTALSTDKVHASIVNNGICLDWNAVSGAEGYHVYRRLIGHDYVEIGKTDENSFTDTDVSNLKYYTYAVLAYNGAYIGNYNSIPITYAVLEESGENETAESSAAESSETGTEESSAEESSETGTAESSAAESSETGTEESSAEESSETGTEESSAVESSETGTEESSAAESSENVKESFAEGDVVHTEGVASFDSTGYYLIAHRGSESGGIQTETSFTLANQQGFWGIEGDVREYKGNLVMAHDEDEPSDDSCTYSDYLDICKDAGAVAIIDIKSVGDGFDEELKRIVDMVTQKGMLEQAVFQCYDISYLKIIRDYCPQAHLWVLAMSVGEMENAEIYAKAVDAEGIDVLNSLPGVGDYIAKFKADGYKVCVNTLTTAAELETFSGYGCDYLMCDEPLL